MPDRVTHGSRLYNNRYALSLKPLTNRAGGGGQTPMGTLQWNNPDRPALQHETESAARLASLEYEAILDNAGHCFHAPASGRLSTVG